MPVRVIFEIFQTFFCAGMQVISIKGEVMENLWNFILCLHALKLIKSIN